MSQFPIMCDVLQHFSTPRLTDIPAAVHATLSRLDLASRIRPGQTVAIPAGSRGVANIGLILREIAAHFTALGAKPFLVPAMGSHGGGTAEGQVKLLANAAGKVKPAERGVHGCRNIGQPRSAEVLENVA
ncbi:MAG: hypothetical protein ACKOEO_17295, partial [Planctomycetaceae bacterium]